nr:NFkB inhibitor [Wadden Sea poxvirus]
MKIYYNYILLLFLIVINNVELYNIRKYYKEKYENIIKQRYWILTAVSIIEFNNPINLTIGECDFITDKNKVSVIGHCIKEELEIDNYFENFVAVATGTVNNTLVTTFFTSSIKKISNVLFDTKLIVTCINNKYIFDSNTTTFNYIINNDKITIIGNCIKCVSLNTYPNIIHVNNPPTGVNIDTNNDNIVKTNYGDDCNIDLNLVSFYLCNKNE